MPTNLPDKLTTPSTVVCQSPDCDVDTDFCDHPKIDVDKQNMQDDVELLTTFADGAGEGSLPWNSDGKCTPTGVPSFKSLMAWLGLQFTQIYCALQNIYNQICSILASIESILDAINDLNNKIWGTCNIRPVTIPFNVSNASRVNLSATSNEVLGQVDIPDIGCDYKMQINMGTYVDQAQHTNGGDPYHLNVHFSIDNPAGSSGYSDHWHGDSATDGVSNGWSDSSSISREINLSGAHTIYFAVRTDIAPVYGTANNVSASATGFITLFKQ
jgi:hypothetical protein